MSKDAKIAHNCTHFIRGERARLTQGRYIQTLSPPSGQISVKRDGIELPREGLRSSHRVTALKRSPYRFKAGSNTLTVNGTEIVIPPSKTYSEKELVAFLNPRLRSLGISSEPLNGAISFYSQSDSFLLEGSILSVSLGFNRDSAYSIQKKIAPSWRLVKEIDKDVVKFSQSLDPEGLLEVSYLTDKRFCRRCGSTGIENDLEVSSDGALTLISDHDLLYQIVAKAVLTERGSNPFYNWYGSNAMALVGGKSTSANKQLLRQYIRECLDKIIDVQDSQSRLQTLTSKERISQVESIEITDLDEVGTSVLCTITVRSASLERVNINLIFAVPGSIPLEGTLT